MVLAPSFSKMGISTMDNTSSEGSMEKENIYGQMDHHMTEALLKVTVKEEGDGNRVKMGEIYMRVNTNKIKNQEKANTPGQTIAFMTENS